jgi:hypothetical protein
MRIEAKPVDQRIEVKIVEQIMAPVKLWLC